MVGRVLYCVKKHEKTCKNIVDWKKLRCARTELTNGYFYHKLTLDFFDVLFPARRAGNFWVIQSLLYWVSLPYILRLGLSLPYFSLPYLGGAEETMVWIPVDP